MRVVYFTKPFLADCVFPFIKEMQSQGIDVRCYMLLSRNFKASSIIELDEPFHRFGLFKASKLPELSKYSDCIDLNKLFIISPINSKWWFFPGVLVWLFTWLHMLFSRPDVFHFDWQLLGVEKLFIFKHWFKKIIMTVHDPIQHTGVHDLEKNECARRYCFKHTDRFVLLNQSQLQVFCDTYGIRKQNVKVSKLGCYDSINHIKIDYQKTKDKYFLFFGSITKYKGIDILLELMDDIHEACPSAKLIVAGTGKLYFDKSLYENKQYIEWRYRYLGVTELTTLVRNAEFTVCPYRDATQSGVIQTAFVLGCPVIVTNVGGLAEMVSHGENGLIVPPNNKEELKKAIIDWLNSPDKVLSAKKNIINKWLPTMSWSCIIQDILLFYSK